MLPFAHFNRLHVVPPCTITDDEARRAWRSSTRRSPWPTDTPPADHRYGRPDELRHLLRPPRPGADVRGRARRGRVLLRERRPGAADRGGPRALGGRAAAGARDPRRPGRDHPARRGDPGAHRPGHRHRHHPAGGRARDPRPGPPGRRGQRGDEHGLRPGPGARGGDRAGGLRPAAGRAGQRHQRHLAHPAPLGRRQRGGPGRRRPPRPVTDPAGDRHSARAESTPLRRRRPSGAGGSSGSREGPRRGRGRPGARPGALAAGRPVGHRGAGGPGQRRASRPRSTRCRWT